MISLALICISSALAASPDEQRLVSGAPLQNSRVEVHTIERKQFADRGKRELIVYPAAVQANGKFTQHVGTTASFVYHLHENFGLQLSGTWHWLNTESALNGELIEKVHQEAEAATSLLLVWGAYGGVETSPLYGKFTWFDRLATFSFVITGGMGVGGTRHQLKPENSAGPATYGDTGNKFLGALGAGFRMQLGDRFAVRLEVRDLVYTARFETVNGCGATDLEILEKGGSGVSGGCRQGDFEDNDVNIAQSLVASRSSDVLHNVGLYLGTSVSF